MGSPRSDHDKKDEYRQGWRELEVLVTDGGIETDAAAASAAMSPGHGACCNPAVAPREIEVQIHRALSTGVPSSLMPGGSSCALHPGSMYITATSPGEKEA